MPDWRFRLRTAFADRGLVPDEEVLDELTVHAEASFETARHQCLDETSAVARTDALIEAWMSQAPALSRRPRHRPAVAPPPLVSSIFGACAHDLRYAGRVLMRHRTFTAVAILVMAVGIAAVTTLWTIVDGVLLRPLPWPDDGRLVRLTETRGARMARVPGTMFNGTYVAWSARPSTIERPAGWLRGQLRIVEAAGAEPVRVAVAPVTPNLLSVLRARVDQGRTFVADEGARNGPAAVILSHGLWTRHFGSDPAVVGSLIRIDSVPHTVVGVMEPGFMFPDRAVEAWTAWQVPGTTGPQGAQVGVLFSAIARLREGRTIEEAAAEGTSIALTAPAAPTVSLALFGSAAPAAIQVQGLRDSLVGDVRPALRVLMGAVVLLFGAAVANVATLQIARATMRWREMALRAAFGAGYSRLLRQLIAENIVICTVAAVLGTGLTIALCRAVPFWLADNFPRQDSIHFDVRALLATFAATAVGAALCSLAPAWRGRRLCLVAVLAGDNGAPCGGTTRSSAGRARTAAVIAEVAVACVLLVGAGLLARSLTLLMQVDRGYDPANLLTAQLSFPASVPVARRLEATSRVIERIRSVPGVAAAGVSTSLPLLSPGGAAVFPMMSPDDPAVEIEAHAAQRIVTPGYFNAMRLRLIDGRFVNESDVATSLPAVVVNASFASTFLGGRAVGARIPQRGKRAGIPFTNTRSDLEVVGVVEDQLQDNAAGSRQPEIFSSVSQMQLGDERSLAPLLVIRTTDDPIAHTSALRSLAREAAPNAVLDSVMTMDARVASSLARPRAYALALALFAVFTIMLSLVALFGVLMYTVALRTREIGMRIALGARRVDVILLVAHDAAGILGAGILVGLSVAFAASRYVESLLFGVRARDPLTFIGAAVLLLAAGCLAIIVPAYRAARLDPADALRHSI
jgi:predicted permease